MLRTKRSPSLALALLTGAFVLAGSSCLVSLDESLIQEGPSDAGSDADASVSEAGDAKDEPDADKPDTNNDADATVEPDADAAPDSPEDVEQPDADAAVEADAPIDVQEAGDVVEPDGDASDGGDPFDGALVECYDDAWCPPVGCAMRKCTLGVCTSAGPMKRDVTTFELPAALQCNQQANRACAVAVRNYLVALTADGFAVFNTRNPQNVRQEYVPNNVGAGYSYLIRSGERLWAVKNSSGDTTELAWLDVPLDGTSPVPPPSRATVHVPYLAARHAAPNDAIYLYHTDGLPMGYVARYVPGLPTTLSSFATNDALETTAMAVSGSRLLLHRLVTFTDIPVTYRHHFSLQSDVLSAQSSNSGSYQEESLTNTSASSGFFATSRTGAVAWVVALRDSTPEWKHVRAYWLVADGSSSIASAYYQLESYTTQPPATPEGPVAFINNDTIVTAVYSGTASPSPMLDVVRRQSGTAPGLEDRIPLSPLAPGALNVAGDAGYAYVITGTTVRMFAPTCAP
jgi:hypothetical protein